MAASPNISREPRQDVAPTIVDAAPTLVDIDSTAPVLSGADLPFQGDGDRTFTLHTADVIGAGGQGTVVATTDEEGRTFVAKIAYQPPRRARPPRTPGRARLPAAPHGRTPPR